MDLPPRGTKLPVPTPISTVTTNKADTDIAPKGNQTTKTTSIVKMFIVMMVFTGPSFRSESHGGSVLPIIAPLFVRDNKPFLGKPQYFFPLFAMGDFDQSECSTYML